MNASEPIRRLARLTPGAPAFARASGETATFAQFDATIDAVAHRVRAVGLAPGQTVALGTVDLYKYLVTALALARAGVAFGPVTLPAHRVDVALCDYGVTGDGHTRTVALEALAPAHDVTQVEPFPSHPGGAATMAYYPSSGTTGRPRFTPVSHALAVHRADGRALGFAQLPGARGTAGVRQACCIAPAASYGFSSLMIALYGGNVVLEAPAEPDRIAVWLGTSQVTYLIASPIMLHRLIAALPSARRPDARLTVEVGGGALAPDVTALARARLTPAIVVNYGATETGRVAWSHAAGIRGISDAGGTPYPGVTLDIVDDDDKPVRPGEEGIVRVKSAQTATGYLDDPEATAEVFRDGFVYPGDRGYVELGGALRVVGRVDDRINVGGYKFNPQAVEDLLPTFADLREAAVFAFTDGNGATRVCAAIVPGAAFDAAAFETQCRTALGARAPHFIMEVRALPRNANGKVLRRELARAALLASKRDGAST